MQEIRKVAVIGAGTMGSGIAGQIANAGVDVLLLDLPGDDHANTVVERAIKRLTASDQPGLIDDTAKQRIKLGNIRDNLQEIGDCDWVVEAILEKLELKEGLYQQIHTLCKPGALITSNTSTIPIRLLVRNMPSDFRQCFAITHFFNPVRYMALLELVKGDETRDDVMAILNQFCSVKLGKGVVECLDTPGFLANRVGVYALQCALHAAFDLGLSPQQADAIFGRPMGIPKTGVFGLYDLIGIDLMADVVSSLASILPPEDAFHREAGVIPIMTTMIDKGMTGAKGGKGFYRRAEDNSLQVLDLQSGHYVRSSRVAVDVVERAVDALFRDESVYGDFARRVLVRTLSYAASLIPEVGDDPLAIDDALRLGYNWTRGPFELMDEIGSDAIAFWLRKWGDPVPPLIQDGRPFYRSEGSLQRRVASGCYLRIDRPEGVMNFREVRCALQPRNRCDVASWYVLEDCALVEFHSKANALTGESMAIIADALDSAEKESLRGLIIHSDAQHFSCGVDLRVVRSYFEREDVDGLDNFLASFQCTVHRLASATVLTIATPHGLTLGGGCEVALHCQKMISHVNAVIGLVESLVGLVPGGGGCKEMLYRRIDQAGGDVERGSWDAFMQLGYGKTAHSPALSSAMGLRRKQDDWLMSRQRLLRTAIDTARSHRACPHPRHPLAMAGSAVFEKMHQWLQDARRADKLTSHDVVVGTELARIVAGGDVAAGTIMSEQELFTAERRAFARLVATPATRERICSMLDNGRPVRN